MCQAAKIKNQTSNIKYLAFVDSPVQQFLKVL
jgi:hypothetical protein